VFSRVVLIYRLASINIVMIALSRKNIRELPEGGSCGEVTPVPIPNTAVKFTSADGTDPVTDWKSRSPPSSGSSLFLWRYYELVCWIL
jgi:hypothetical protein